MSANRVWSILAALVFGASPWYLNAQNQVSGVINSPQGRPLNGVRIVAFNSNASTTSDSNGEFFLDLTSFNDSIGIIQQGFQSQTLAVSAGQYLIVELSPKSYRLAEVQIIGFGEQIDSRQTGAQSRVDAQAFENISITGWESALQGRAAGVAVTMASGGQEAPASIRIRGVGSINASNQPLIVVDGLILSGANISNTFAYQTNPFAAINPADIASVEILKDAAATAVYGSRGANGVILITTKSGSFNSKPQVHLGFYAGWREVSKRWNLLNGPQYARLFNQAVDNIGDTTITRYQNPDMESTTDWQDLMLRRGLVLESQAGISGGTEQTRYAISGTYRDEEGYLLNTDFQRYSLNASLEQKLGEKWKVGLSLLPSQVDNRRNQSMWGASPFAQTAWFAPNISAYNDDGSLNTDNIQTSNGSFSWAGFTPLTSALDQGIETKTHQLLTQGQIEFSPIKQITIQASAGLEYSHLKNKVWLGPNTIFGAPDGEGGRDDQMVLGYQWLLQADYQSQWQPPHQLEATTGIQYNRTALDFVSANGVAIPGIDIRQLIGTAQITNYSAFQSASAFLGYFGRAQYSYRNTLLVSLSARYDGSSRFGRDKRYGFFPAASIGWNLANSLKMGPSINLLKVRLSYGITGNAEIGDFASFGEMSFQPSYLGNAGASLTSLENPELSWEKSYQFNLGLDFSLWKGRLQGAIELFRRDSRDLLFEVPIPANNGSNTLLSNTGSVRNQGLEFTLEGQIFKGPFIWHVQINGSWLQNQVLSLADFDGDGRDDRIIDGIHILEVGQQLGSFFLVPFGGVNPDNGDGLYQNRDGSLTSVYNPDVQRQIVGGSIPSFSGGLVNRFEVAGFDLSIFMIARIGHSIYQRNSFSLASLIESNFSDSWAPNQLANQVNSWTKQAPYSEVPEARLGQNNGAQVSTRYLSKADFLRINNLTFGYTPPFRWSSGQSLRIFASAQNLWILTSYPGLDPDSEFAAPQTAAQGIVNFNLPAARSFTFGFDLTL